jgi:hypothetical protein
MQEVNLTQEIQYLSQIRQALGEVSVKGNDVVIMANIMQATEQLAKSITDKVTEYNTTLKNEEAKAARAAVAANSNKSTVTTAE